MFIKDIIVDLLNKNDGKVYIYVTKSKQNLDKVRVNSNENIDFSKTSTKIVLTFPMGLGYIRGKVDGIFYDKDETTQGFIANYVELTNDTFFQEIDPETQELL